MQYWPFVSLLGLALDIAGARQLAGGIMALQKQSVGKVKWVEALWCQQIGFASEVEKAKAIERVTNQGGRKLLVGFALQALGVFLAAWVE